MAVPTERLKNGHALLVVDVQPDFCPGGALPIERGDEVIPVLNEWITAARERGIPIYASRDWHPPKHLSFKDQGGQWPRHCIQDTPGAAFHPDLHLPDDAIRVCKGVRLDKDQYSAFDDTGLADHMRNAGIKSVWTGGLAQDVCVRASVLEGIESGFEMHLIENATRPVDADNGRRAIDEMVQAGACLERES